MYKARCIPPTKYAMESAYTPENACFAAISATDFESPSTRGFCYGYFAPGLPDGEQTCWRSLTGLGGQPASKRQRGELVPPGTLIYVAKPLTSLDTIDPIQVAPAVRHTMPIGIATDGIQLPFTTASLQVSGVGCVRTGAVSLDKLTHASTTNLDLHDCTNTATMTRYFSQRAYGQDTSAGTANIPYFGVLIPSEGEVARKIYNAHKSWQRISIEVVRNWKLECASQPPFKRTTSADGRKVFTLTDFGTQSVPLGKQIVPLGPAEIQNAAAKWSL